MLCKNLPPLRRLSMPTMLCMMLLIACRKDDPDPPAPAPGVVQNGWTLFSLAGEHVSLGSGPSALYAIIWSTNWNVTWPAPPTQYSAGFKSCTTMNNSWSEAPLMSGPIGTNQILFGSPTFVNEQIGYFHFGQWYRTTNSGQRCV